MPPAAKPHSPGDDHAKTNHQVAVEVVVVEVAASRSKRADDECGVFSRK